MKTAMLFLGIIGTVVLTAYGAEEDNYYETIVALAKDGTASGKQELGAYLKSLTRDQMLTAARQYSRIAQGKVPPAMGTMNLGLVLAYYREDTGGASDDSLDKLLAIIADDNETEFLRHALANMLYGGFFGFPRRFADGQEERVLKTLISVLCDKAAPPALRHQCSVSLRGLLQEAYTAVIYSDPAVREVQRTGPRERFQNVFSLIDAGEVQLAEETKARLVEPRKRIHALRDILTAIAQDESEPERLRRFADACLTSTATLPLLELEARARKGDITDINGSGKAW